MPFGKNTPPDVGKKYKFKPGKSGNPKGRPRKLPELDKLLADVLGEEKNGVTAAEAILMRLRAVAASGNTAASIRAAEVLLDRAYGKTRQPIEGKLDINLSTVDTDVKGIIEKFGLLGSDGKKELPPSS